MVCPQEVGFLRCTVQSGLVLGWEISAEREFFIAADQVGEMLTLSSIIGNSTAYLLERGEDIQTSILSHEIDPNFMGTFVIICDGGNANKCNQTVYVIGGKYL